MRGEEGVGSSSFVGSVGSSLSDIDLSFFPTVQCLNCVVVVFGLGPLKIKKNTDKRIVKNESNSINVTVINQ